jgi:glutamyl-tRNA reductase
MDKKPLNLEVDNFFCLSLAYNPITETTPKVFEIENKGKKEKFTEEILANKLGGIFDNLIMIKTCQRVELYFHSDNDVETISSEFVSFYKRYFDEEIGPFLKVYPSKKALTHLISLCSGLKSFIIGEKEIYQQVIKLFYYYQTNKCTSDKLDAIFDYCISIASKIRKDILDDSKIASYSELLQQFLTDKGLVPSKIIILGKGLLSQSISESLNMAGTPNEVREDCNLEKITDGDLLVNCNSKVVTDENVVLKNNRMIDFSMPPVFETVSDIFLEYHSLKDFKDHIKENNNKVEELSQKAYKYIEECLSLV